MIRRAARRYTTDQIPQAGRWGIYDNQDHAYTALVPDRRTGRRMTRKAPLNAVARDAWSLTVTRLLWTGLVVDGLGILHCAARVHAHHDVTRAWVGIGLGVVVALAHAVVFIRRASRRKGRAGAGRKLRGRR